MSRIVRALPVTSLLLLALCGCQAPTSSADESADTVDVFDPASRVHVTEGSDDQAIAIAQATVEKMGGWQAWDRTRYLSWKFFGGRQHYWDRWTGDIRIEATDPEGNQSLWLMNVQNETGRHFSNGEETVDAEPLAAALDQGRQIWVNDSYWLIMPFKLLDPGVTLRYDGERALLDGRAADVLELTFTDVGYTPQNRYHVFVAKETGLVEQWSFFADAADEEPGYTLPWTGWQSFGDVQIATERGRERDWEIAVHDALPASVFRDEAEVSSSPGA